MEEKEKLEGYELWTTIGNSGLESQTNIILEEYQSRNNIINLITNLLLENELNGVIIDFKGINNSENFERFIIELTPRLREMGISVGIHFNDENINKDKIKTIVDYIVQ